ncbi:AAA family ATPase [Acinetobacter sp. dk771]|uniref:AAA family ATPase n=1 Tax=Acinetobacter wanghuae TaxID=2662362 RepID=A0AA91AHA1_9GAMM|nr:ParA family protein [Acinetobacter wanghuae]MQW93017.1 AAA family ATPase [Acinetobacter wanghuae]
MKKVVASNQKGGVGKSAIICQYAHYLNSLGLRVLVIDLDHQKNTTKALITGGAVTVANVSAFDMLTKEDQTISNPEAFTLVQATPELTAIEKNGTLHNNFATNYQKFLKSVDSLFDVCLIDTNPNPDIRQVASLIVSDYVLSPIQLNQEAIDGIGGLLKQIQAINQKLNPNLKLIGILPNIVEPTPFQKDNLKAIVQHFSKYLIKNSDGSYAFVKKTTAIAEAQAQGIPTNKLGKTSGFTAWTELKTVFESINKFMEI